MKEWVLTFLFDGSKQNVLLIKKERPEFQKGLLNGIGGSVEPYETYVDAAVRELKEEANIDISGFDLTKIGSFGDGRSWRVVMFKGRWDGEFSSLTDEQVVKIPVKDLQNMNKMSNLDWMIPLCLDEKMGVEYRLSEI